MTLTEDLPVRLETRVAICTFEPVVGDLQANAARSIEGIHAARRDGAEIIVMPELCLSGYALESRAELETVAMTAEDSIFDTWATALGESAGLVIGSFAERMADGTFCISAAVVSNHGLVSVYRKTHLWNTEKRFFRPGDEKPPVLSTPWGNIGVLICYDLEFPELSRSLVMRGADLIAVPTNWSANLAGAQEEPGQVVVARAMARVNHVFLAVADRTGEERGQAFAGGSVIVNTEGAVLARQRSEGVAVADLDLSLAAARNHSPVNHVLGDRRPELYE